MAGRLHVDDVLAELSGDELDEWRAYYMLEPWGDDWRRTATLSAVFAEAHRNQEARSEPFGLEDFMPKFSALNDEDETAAPIAENDDVDEEEPAWKKWKAAFALMADATEDKK